MVTGAKASLRTQVRRTRAARAGSAAGRDDAAALASTALASGPVRRLLATAAPNRTVVAYAALPGEPDLAPLRESLRGTGTRVLLPVVGSPGRLLWAVDTGVLRPGRELPGGLRVAEPDGVRLPDLAGAGLGPDDLVLVPALAVSRDGTRLGQGGGFYDRALAGALRHPHGPRLVAVVHDDELLPAAAVPAEPHDLRVDAVLTPSAWVDLDPAAGEGR